MALTPWPLHGSGHDLSSAEQQERAYRRVATFARPRGWHAKRFIARLEFAEFEMLAILGAQVAQPRGRQGSLVSLTQTLVIVNLADPRRGKVKVLKWPRAWPYLLKWPRAWPYICGAVGMRTQHVSSQRTARHSGTARPHGGTARPHG